MKTELNLLTRDGACFMKLSHSLTAAEYLEVGILSKTADTRAEMRAKLQKWATVKGLRFWFEE